MKLAIPVFALALLLGACGAQRATTNNGRNALDWRGTYTGILPCADCEGILTTVTLNDNLSYTMQSTALGKSETPTTSTGLFAWNNEGSAIIFTNPEAGKSPVSFRVGEGRLVQLDTKGQPIAGNLAARYVLQKATAGPENKYWRLVELMGNPVVRTADDREPYLILHADGSRVSGYAGCNSFSGTFEKKRNNHLRFSPLAVTKKACPNNDQPERQFLQALQQSDSYNAGTDTLRLTGGGATPLAKLVAVYMR